MIEPILGKLGAGKVDAREHRLFRSLDVENSGEIRVADLLDVVDRVGLSRDDDRIADCLQAVQGYGLRDRVAYEEFCAAIRPNILLVEQALQGNMIIPDFQAFSSRIQAIYEQTSENRTGEVASYIPQLARVDPNRFGVSLCTIDGQRYSVGDARVHFSVQSSCKPMNYCLALEEHGEDGVHTYVGREPSGRDFNELTLNDAGKPHNPMINAGAIMCTSLIRQDLNSSERFDYLLGWWEAMCGNQKVGFSNSVYQSERSTADRNFALGYYIREHRAFPEGTDLLETLEFYFQCCSIEVNAECMAVLAATLANGGVCPTTGERILKTRNVQHCLSLMCSCGMYDFSGEFAFAIGLPAKSSVSGVLMVVIPNVLGLCVWSPTLDANGNSVRGIEFCRELVESFSFHNYDSLTGVSEKLDPRLNWIESKAEKVDQLIWAASKGDIGALHRLIVRGYDQDGADYDRRTPLHLAAAQGQEHVVRYFIENGAKLDPQDRWGGCPWTMPGVTGRLLSSSYYGSMVPKLRRRVTIWVSRPSRAWMLLPLRKRRASWSSFMQPVRVIWWPSSVLWPGASTYPALTTTGGLLFIWPPQKAGNMWSSTSLTRRSSCLPWIAGEERPWMMRLATVMPEWNNC